MDTPKNRKLYAEIVAKAWTDEAFKAALLKDPNKTVRDCGIILPPDAVVSVVSCGDGFVTDTICSPPTLELTLPPRPADPLDEAILAFSERYAPCIASGSGS
jgi:hypothetical protein